MSTYLFHPNVGVIPIQVVVTERLISSIGLTDNPIETGAKITDHAYIEPDRLTVEIATGMPEATYQKLKQLQRLREPFFIASGLDRHPKMMLQAIEVQRDQNSSRILSAVLDLREVIFVSTGPSVGKEYVSPENTKGEETQMRAQEPVNRGEQNATPIPRTPGNSWLWNQFNSPVDSSIKGPQ